MADNSFQIRNSLTLYPQSSIPTNPTNGDAYYDSNANTFIYYDNGQWINLASRTDVASATNLTSAQFTAAVVQNPFVRITGNSAGDIHGLSASTGGKQLILYNQSTVNMIVVQQSATEPIAANRIITSTGSNVTLGSGMLAMFVYDDSQSRWIMNTFAASQSVVNTYPNLYVANETDLANAISTASTDGGSVICLLNSFSISAPYTIPPDTVLIGRKGLSVITVLTGGSLAINNYSTMRDVYVSTALTSGTLVTLGNNRAIVTECKFTVPSSSTTVCINVTGNFNLILNSVFIGVAAPSTGVGIEYTSGSGNSDSNCLFES